MRRVLILGAALLLALPALARALEASVVVVESTAPLKSWNKSAKARLPAGELEAATPGHEIYFAFATRGLLRGKDGKCHAWVDFEVRAPTGELLMRHRKWPELRRKIHPEDIGKWSLLLPPLDLTFGVGDPAGDWVISGTLYDAVAEQSIPFERKLKLIQSESR
ncbi:MAG: hypothetical protein KDH09_07130 [Chrysiogenetes bacterium]|nr:hypothetical protein [Chrysiogenetes bacterium]